MTCVYVSPAMLDHLDRLDDERPLLRKITTAPRHEVAALVELDASEIELLREFAESTYLASDSPITRGAILALLEQLKRKVAR